MATDPLQVLQAASRPIPSAGRPHLLIAGATGTLGNEVLHRLVASGRYASAQVLAKQPIIEGVRGVRATVVPSDDPGAWPLAPADVGIVLFEPPRLFYDRERALWTPDPRQLPALARWMRACGVHTLAIVLPHASGRLPEGLKRGLASLDEHAVATAGFDRLLILRSAQKPAPAGRPSNPLVRLAQWMLSISGYMVPASEQPVRPASIAELLVLALDIAPPGIHVAAPEIVWQAAQGELEQVARRWLS